MRLVDPDTILRSPNYADALRVQTVMKYMKAGCHWTQGKLRNVPINYREDFNDETLTVTMTVKVSELLAMKGTEKPKASTDNHVSR